MNSKSLFISYSRKNKEVALKLAQQLKSKGVPVWLDLLNLEPGTHWDIAIQNALEDATGIVVILSPPAVASTYVLSEIDCALEQQKKIIPLLLEDCRVPLLLRRVQYIDFKESFDAGFLILLEELKAERTIATTTQTSTIPENTQSEVQSVSIDNPALEEQLISPEEIEMAKRIHVSRVRRLYHLLIGLGALSAGILVLFILNFVNKGLDFQDLQQQILVLILAVITVCALFIYRKIGDRDSRIQLIELFELKRNRLERAISRLTPDDIDTMNADFSRLATI